ncbi:MAG: phosphatase PAP2 family protein [Candidatus Thalassarchaeaceae archaeon]|nr:phosphatase PAP2 family protein [Candidatus Thalassarchaeaceae archaeon]
MAVGTSIYLTWITGAIVISIGLMPLFKPDYAKIRISGFIDMFRRYWAHMIVVFSVYLWKDLLDQLDRILMANTQLDMTPYVYAIEGDIVFFIQSELQNSLLSVGLTHFYVMGFMAVTFSSFVYPIFFDDRYMADRVSLSMFWVYILAIPFYLFFNVRVTGNYIPEMETIAYDLTPEIHNWFIQIDPFTNGMPSLHIGLPFAIWLTMERWDSDERWLRYRRLLLLFIVLTGFTILYLGIHWVSDIIGGIIVAVIAVEITSKTHAPIWRFADERLFSRRLARAIDDPKKWTSESWKMVKNLFSPLKQPSSSQTKAFIASLLFITSSVLLWDATHQDFPIEGVNPTKAAGSEGWVVGIEEIGPDININLWNVSTQQETVIGGISWVTPPSIELSNNSFILFDNFHLDFFQLDNISLDKIEPIFSITENLTSDKFSIGENVHGDPYLVKVTNGSMEIINVLLNQTVLSNEIGNLTAIEASGSFIASAFNTANGPIINVTTLFSPSIEINILIETFSNDLNDEYLERLYEVPVDYNNSTVLDIEMDENFIVITVDVGPLNRLILIDTLTGEQTMLSNPLWPAESPSIEGNYIAFLQRPITSPSINLDPLNFNRDVFLWDIDGDQGAIQIPTEDNSDHYDPYMLSNGITWITIDEDGNSELVIYQLENTFEEYSSVVLQAAVLLLIPLLLVWSQQSALEKRPRD